MEIVSQIRVTKEGDRENTRMPMAYRCRNCGHTEYRNYDDLKS